MDATNQRTLRLTWDGKEYECLPNMRTLMMIEERVLLHRLGTKIIQGPSEIPPSHLQWVIYCLLHCAGAQLTADDVHRAAADGRLETETMVTVATWIIAEVFGVGPEPDEDAEGQDGEGGDESGASGGKPAA